jgi:hypothetical protein
MNILYEEWYGNCEYIILKHEDSSVQHTIPHHRLASCLVHLTAPGLQFHGSAGGRPTITV